MNMMDQTATVIFESPRGRGYYIEDVQSATTREDGTIDVAIEGTPDLVEVGWDWKIREIWTAEQIDAIDIDDRAIPYGVEP